MIDLIKHLTNYLNYLTAQNYSPRSLESYEFELKFFFNWLKEKNSYSLDKINYDLLLKYQSYLTQVKSKHTKKNLSLRTQSSKLIAIKGFFKYLIKTDVILNNPAHKIKLPRKQKLIKWALLSIREIKKILLAPNLSNPAGLRDRAILELLYTTGIRATELCNLKIDDIDYKNNMVRINAGKGNKDRTVPACDRALNFTKQYIKTTRKKKANEKSGKYIFLAYTGNKLKKGDISQRIHRYEKKIKLKKSISAQCFRIACATHMLKNKADIRYVQQMLGHADIDTTHKYLMLEKSELKYVHTLTHPREIIMRD